MGVEQLRDLIEKLSILFPIIEITSDADWINKTFWGDIYPKLRKKSLFMTEIEDLLTHGQIVNVPLVFFCTGEVSEKQFSEFLTLEKDIAFFVMLEDRRHPFLSYRSFEENSENKIDYTNFMERLSL